MNQDQIRVSHFNQRYLDKTYEATTPLQKKVWEIVSEYIDTIPNIHVKAPDRGKWTRSCREKGLLLMGGSGTGKTLLGHLVLRAAIERDHPCRVVDFFEYVNEKRDLMDPNLSDRKRTAYTEYVDDIEESTVHYMLIDDLGKEYQGATEWAPSIFHRLMRRRGNAMQPVIITTNLTPDEIEMVYGYAVWSHINEVCKIVATGDNDLRVEG